MSIWLFRAGSTGEYEDKFLQDKKIYLTWDDLNYDLNKLQTKEELNDLLHKVYPSEKAGRYRNWLGQIWPIAHSLSINDWVVLPSKKKAVIHIGKVIGEYEFHKDSMNPFYHSRKIDWFAQDIPRSNFDQDILYSLGAFMTVCKISRNDAETRIKAMSENSWKSISYATRNIVDKEDDNYENEQIDIEQFSIDSIAKILYQKLKGHGMARLIDSILKAQGYITYISPEGPDKGIDILASPGSFGFGSPKICVQVKSQDTPIDRPTLDQLIGTMQNFRAEQGILVSWNGFKSTVYKEIPNHFFKVRLWDQNDIIKEFLNVYEKIDEDIKSEIPLKKIWAIATIDS